MKKPHTKTEMSLAQTEEIKVHFAWHKSRQAHSGAQNMIWLEPWSSQLEI